MRYTFYEVIIEAVRGDIANQPDLEAIVNAANARLTRRRGRESDPPCGRSRALRGVPAARQSKRDKR